MLNVTINVENRQKGTKGALHELRKSGKVPGILYHSGEEAKMFSAQLLELRQLIYTNESHIVNLKFPDGSESQAIVKSSDFDAVTDKLIHIDFLEIRAGEEIEIEVPVMVHGTSEGEKFQGGKLHISAHKVPIKCKPVDILGHIDLDVTAMKLGESIHFGDIQKKLDASKYKVVGDAKNVVLTIAAPTKEKEPVAAVAVEAVVEEAKPAAEEKKEKKEKK